MLVVCRHSFIEIPYANVGLLTFSIRINQLMSYAVVSFIGKMPSLRIQAGIATFGGDAKLMHVPRI